MTGRWVKKQRWLTSHLLRDDVRRPRNQENTEVGRTVCGTFITLDEHLENEPTGMDTCDRCTRCEQAQRWMTGREKAMADEQEIVVTDENRAALEGVHDLMSRTSDADLMKD